MPRPLGHETHLDPLMRCCTQTAYRTQVDRVRSRHINGTMDHDRGSTDETGREAPTSEDLLQRYQCVSLRLVVKLVQCGITEG